MRCLLSHWQSSPDTGGGLAPHLGPHAAGTAPEPAAILVAWTGAPSEGTTRAVAPVRMLAISCVPDLGHFLSLVSELESNAAMGIGDDAGSSSLSAQVEGALQG